MFSEEWPMYITFLWIFVIGFIRIWMFQRGATCIITIIFIPRLITTFQIHLSVIVDVVVWLVLICISSIRLIMSRIGAISKCLFPIRLQIKTRPVCRVLSSSLLFITIRSLLRIISTSILTSFPIHISIFPTSNIVSLIISWEVSSFLLIILICLMVCFKSISRIKMVFLRTILIRRLISKTWRPWIWIKLIGLLLTIVTFIDFITYFGGGIRILMLRMNISWVLLLRTIWVHKWQMNYQINYYDKQIK